MHTQHPDSVKHVEYTLTPLRAQLAPAIDALASWAEAYCAAERAVPTLEVSPERPTAPPRSTDAPRRESDRSHGLGGW